MKDMRITEAARLLGRTPLTVKHWFWWVDTYRGPKVPPTLPEYERRGSRGDWYIDSKDLYMLKTFSDWLQLNRGVMAEYNRTRKGEVGKLQQERSEFRELFKKIM